MLFSRITLFVSLSGPALESFQVRGIARCSEIGRCSEPPEEVTDICRFVVELLVLLRGGRVEVAVDSGTPAFESRVSEARCPGDPWRDSAHSASRVEFVQQLYNLSNVPLFRFASH